MTGIVDGFSDDTRFIVLSEPFLGTSEFKVYTLAELREMGPNDGVFPHTELILESNHDLRINYWRIAGPRISVSPPVSEFLKSRAECQTTVLCGPNNSGKSLMLKEILRRQGPGTYLVGVNRFYHVGSINSREIARNAPEARYQSSVTQLSQEQNSDANSMTLEEIITTLNNKDRNRLFSYCRKVLGHDIEMKRVDSENRLSPYILRIDGQPLGVSSSGVRLLVTIVGLCMIRSHSVVLLDEPEIGLSPKAQAALASTLFSPKKRAKIFPNLKQLFIASHSHLFIDTGDPKNNFELKRTGSNVRLLQAQSRGELHHFRFELLGSTLESLCLPSAIIVVEGPSDRQYLTRVLELRMPESRITVLAGRAKAKGEGEIPAAVYDLRRVFGDFSNSAYSGRIHVMLDVVHSAGTIKKLEALGVKEPNVTVLKKNGIEFYYPEEIVANLFGCGLGDIGNMKIEEDTVTINGDSKRKLRLCEEVVRLLDSKTTYSVEFESFLSKIEKTVSGLP